MWFNVGLFQMVGPGGLISSLPCPNIELGLATQSKEWAVGFLKLSGLREAGFTEQRTVPALCSGKITSRYPPKSNNA